MQVIYPCCCGVDVHKKFVVACLLRQHDDGSLQREVRTFSTVTQDLLAMADRLLDAGCTHLAMESTGYYSKPLDNLLEGQFEILVVNAQHIKIEPTSQPHHTFHHLSPAQDSTTQWNLATNAVVVQPAQ